MAFNWIKDLLKVKTDSGETVAYFPQTTTDQIRTPDGQEVAHLIGYEIGTSAPEGFEFSREITEADVVDNLLSSDKKNPLSANQGRVLKESIDSVNSNLNNMIKIKYVDISNTYEIGYKNISAIIGTDVTYIETPHNSHIPVWYSYGADPNNWHLRWINRDNGGFMYSIDCNFSLRVYYIER